MIEVILSHPVPLDVSGANNLSKRLSMIGSNSFGCGY